MGEGSSGGRHMGLRRARRAFSAALWVLALAILGLALSSSSALALSQRGHAFGFSFGGPAPAEGELSKPSGVAVNESSDEAYVVNPGKMEVDRFACTTSPCTFVAAFPVKSTPEYIAIDNSSGPSAGDVYVSATVGTKEQKKGAVFKFNAEGTQIGKVSGIKEAEKGSPLEPFGRIRGLAVGANGILWVDESGFGLEAIDRFSGEAVNKFLPPALEGAPAPGAPGFAVDAKEDVYAGHEPFSSEEEATCEEIACVVAKLSTVNEEAEAELQVLVPELLSEDTTAAAVDLSGAGVFLNDAYLATVAGGVASIAVLSPSGSLIQRFGVGEAGFAGLKSANGVAVDSKTGSVYVADATAGTVDAFLLEQPGPPKVDDASAAKVSSRSAELKAQIDPAGAETTYTFQYGAFTPVSCSGSSSCEAPIPAASVGGGFGDQPASVSLTGLAPGTEYHYRVLARNTTAKSGTITVASEERTFTTSGTSGELVLPDGREWEMVSPPAKQGAGIEPIREEGGAIQASANGDAIAYVADAPIVANPEGNRNPEIAQVLSIRGAQGWSSQDISTADETSLGPEAGQANEYRLFSPELSLSLVFPFVGAREATPLAEPALSPPAKPGEVQEKTAYVRADRPLSPEASNKSAYEEALSNGEVMHNPGYVALVTAVNDTAGNPFGGGRGKLKLLNATPDLTHVALTSAVPLTAAQKSAPAESLYEWSAGKPAGEQLQLISTLPNGTLASGKIRLGSSLEGDSRHAISNSGSRIFWSATFEGPGAADLFMRDTSKGQTIQLDQVAGGGPGFHEALFQTATSDGSTVLFTATQPLTEGSGAEGTAETRLQKADLFECEIVEVEVLGEEKDKCNLSDLTPKHEGESAGVLGTVLGATEEPEKVSRVYFVANGVLSSNENSEKEKATPGSCPTRSEGQPEVPPLGATCNLYMSTRDEAGKYTTTFIARLSAEDSPDWETFQSDLGRITSRVSPNGRYLTFMSGRSITGYNNSDVNSGQPDEEVYRYDGQTNRLSCASCNPSGQRPLGVLDTPNAGEGVGLLIDRPQIWSTSRVDDNPWLAGSLPGWEHVESRDRAIYQSRYLENNGRLYFNSSDALVPQDTNGKEDVYQYEPEGLAGCTSSSATFSAKSGGCVSLISSGSSEKESAFLDASESGGDVFFLTAAKLLPQDVDTSFDVYDAHECTAESPCLPPLPSGHAPCGSEAECRGASPSLPTFGAPSSTTFSGAGNVVAAQQALPFSTVKKPPTRAQLLAKALKTCKKKKSKSRRAACERQARKKYGPAHAKKAGTSRRGSVKGSSR